MSMQYLIDRLEKDDTIEKVWFNETGGWTLNADPKHNTERTREEVLDHWNELSDIEKSEMYGIPSTAVEEENDVNEKVRLLEEENSNLGNEVAELKDAYEELKEEYQRLQSTLAVKDKSIEDLKKKLSKKEDKTAE